MNINEFFFFGGFLFLIFLILALDLGIFHRKDHAISSREAAFWSIIWLTVSLAFYLLLYKYGDRIHGIDSWEKLYAVIKQYNQPVKIISGDFYLSLENYRKVLALEYLTGYIIEQSLSIDNIFVILLIFSAFGVEKRYYHRVLFWGILGAIVFRFIFIFTGAFLIAKFYWIIHLFAIFLVFTGIKMFLTRNKEDSISVENNFVVRIASKYFAVHPNFEGNKFFIKTENKNYVTPLFLVLLIVEFTDLLFAIDSIPAIFAITKDPYIVFFSNIFAILGLRSMFFLLLNVVYKFHYFKTGLSILLIVIGIKMFFNDFLKEYGFTTVHSLLIIVSILAGSIIASLLFPKKK